MVNSRKCMVAAMLPKYIVAAENCYWMHNVAVFQAVVTNNLRRVSNEYVQ